jgi:hypothetical protein
LKPHTLQKSKRTSVEVPDTDPGTCSRVDMKEQEEELLINRNVEQFSHVGDTPFCYSELRNELGHTGNIPMAESIYTGTFEHRSLTYHNIFLH